MIVLRRMAALTLLAVAIVLMASVRAPEAAATKDLNVALSLDPGSLDPRIVWNMPGMSLLGHLYDHLLFVDEKGTLIPQLATSWEWKTPTTLRFHLRKGVKFHNGEPFNAESVKFTIESSIAPDSKSPHKSFLGSVESVQIVDAYTVDIKTKAPARPLLRNLTYSQMMAPKATPALGKEVSTKAVGTGPFKLVEYVPGQRVVMERFDDYWGPKAASRRLVFRILTEDGTRLAALQAGEVAFANNVPFDQVKRLDADPNLKVLVDPGDRIVFLALRYDREPFSKRDVRMAVNHAIDRDAIVKHILGGRGQVANAPVGPTIFGYAPMKPYEYNPDEARRLLARAGYPQGLKIKLGSTNGRNPMDKQVAEAIVGQLAQVGIQAELEAPEWGTFLSSFNGGKYDAALLGWGAASGEPDFILTLHFDSKFSPNKYSNERVDALLDQARREFDAAAVKKIYADAEARIWDDAPWAPLYFQPIVSGVTKTLRGYRSYPSEYLIFRGASVD
jgi:peptide/nickel transport system substrate-binding protein